MPFGPAPMTANVDIRTENRHALRAHAQRSAQIDFDVIDHSRASVMPANI
jgi:hypothetical protein